MFNFIPVTFYNVTVKGCLLVLWGKEGQLAVSKGEEERSMKRIYAEHRHSRETLKTSTRQH